MITIEILENDLSKIGWSIKHHGLDYWSIYNEKGEQTQLWVENDRLVSRGIDNIIIHFSLLNLFLRVVNDKSLCVQVLDDSLEAKDFLLLMPKV